MLLLFLPQWTFRRRLPSGLGVLEFKAPPPFGSSISSIRIQYLRMQYDLVSVSG